MPSASGAADARHSHQLNVAAGIQVALFIFVYLLLCGKAHAAPVLFDRANYASLAKSDSAATIEPGTQITLGNWQRYRRFLPFGIQILYGGRNFWHVGSSAEFTITVGPTIDYTWPRQYRGVWRAPFLRRDGLVAGSEYFKPAPD